MKVLITSPTYPPFNSGLGNVAQQQAAALVRKGWTVVVATGGAKRLTRSDPDSGATVEEFNVRGSDSLLQPLGGDVASYEQFLVKSSFDVVLLNAWQTWSTDLALRALRRINARVFVFSNCVSTNLFLSRQPVRSLLRYLAWRPYWMRMARRMEQLDGLIFVSEEGCDSRFDDLEMAKRIGISYSVIQNPLSEKTVNFFESHAAGVVRDQLLAVGSYHWTKGHDFVLRAYAGSHAKNRIKLKIIGQKFTTYTDKLRRLAESLHISSDFLSFHENVPVDELLNEYAKAIVFLYGSHTECQPLVLVDAMAAGTPFVSRASGCIPFLAGGLAVRKEAEAATAIDYLLDDGNARLQLSLAGRNEANSRHHPEVFAESLNDVLQGAEIKG